MNLLSILPLLLPVILAVIGLSVLAALVDYFSGKSEVADDGEVHTKRPYTYRRKPFFMTRAENNFFQGLRKAVGDDYVIFAQVHLPTIVDEKVPGQDWKSARWKIDRKSVDFVLCDPVYLNPKLAIELDDPSHERPERQDRDRYVEGVLEQAQLALLRISYKENFSVDDLRTLIKAKLHKPA